MVIATLCAALIAFVVIALHLATMALVVWRGAVRKKSRLSPQVTFAPLPFICLLRPVCGLDPFDAETLASSFTLDYPDYEVVFCAADPADPVVGLVRRLIAAFPHVRARILIGEDRITANPKLNNLQKGWIGTDAEWVAMADSNLLLPRSYLRDLVAEMESGVGLVTSPPLGERGDGLWGNVECAFLNTNQARWQLAADALGMGFAQGKTMFWRRATLDDVGGLTALGRQLAEDVTATKVVREAGLQVRLVTEPYAQPIGRRSLHAVWNRQLRWARVRRDGFRGLFALELLNGPFFGVVAALALGAFIGAPLVPVTYLALWYGAEIGFARLMGWGGTSLRELAAWLARDLMLPALWTMTWLRPGFVWRGTVIGAQTGRRTPHAETAHV
jgi:ceramide glucosyltransferase